MKLKNLLYLFLIPALTLSLVACDDDDDNNSEYPKTIDTKDLLVNGDTIHQAYFVTPTRDSVYVINSDIELFALRNPDIAWLDFVHTSNVDYTTQSVLLICGNSNGIVPKPEKGKYIKTGEQTFEIQVAIPKGCQENLLYWNQAFVVSKVDKNAKINAKVTYVIYDCEL